MQQQQQPMKMRCTICGAPSNVILCFDCWKARELEMGTFKNYVKFHKAL